MRSFFFFLVLLSCSKAPAPTENRLRISFHNMPVTADPRRSGDFISASLICMIFEGLTRCAPDGSTELALAEKVDISSDGLIYTFHLRPSLWSDKTPVTARDFAESWKKSIDPAFPSLCSYLFYSIRNAEKAYKEHLPLDQVGIAALDEATLQVTLERPNPLFLSLTAFPAYLPVPAHRPDQFEGIGPLVVNGPFVIQDAQTKSHIRLAKNPHFWNPPSVHLDEIDIAIVSSETTALKMFERGELDWLGGAISPLPPDSLPQKNLRFFPMAATTFCAFNTSHPLLQNVHLRQALSLSINRPEIVSKITQLGETPATRCIPPALIGLRNKTVYQPYDLELARLHLSKVPALGPLTLTFGSTQTDRLTAQALQRQWKEALGLDIDLEQCEQKTFKERLHNRTFDIALTFWIAQFSDPINILERFQDAANFKNYPGWQNPAYAALITQINATTDRLTRYQLIEKAEQIFLDDMPLAPLYHWSNPSLCQQRVHNLQTTPNGGFLFERCWIGQP